MAGTEIVWRNVRGFKRENRMKKFIIVLIIIFICGCVVVIGNYNTVHEAPKGIKDPNIRQNIGTKKDSIK